MNAKLNKRMAALETIQSPKEGVADAIRRVSRGRDEGVSYPPQIEGGPITADILKARSEHQAQEV